MVRHPIPVALNAFVSGLAMVMTAFTIADISSGGGTTVLYIGAVMWPLVAVVTGLTARVLQRDKQQMGTTSSDAVNAS